MFTKKIYFCGSILPCGISNINAFCCKNSGKNLTIDLDDLKFNTDIFSRENFCGILDGHLLDLDKESIEKIKKLNKELEELQKKHKLGNPDYDAVSKEIDKKEQEIEKVKLNKFYFELSSIDEKKNYEIRCKKTNVNIKGYKKAKEEFKDILNLYQKQEDNKYEGGSNLSKEDEKKLNNFKNSNGEFFILAKNTYLEKKRKGSNESKVVLYTEYLDIYKKV